MAGKKQGVMYRDWPGLEKKLYTDMTPEEQSFIRYAFQEVSGYYHSIPEGKRDDPSARTAGMNADQWLNILTRMQTLHDFTSTRNALDPSGRLELKSGSRLGESRYSDRIPTRESQLEEFKKTEMLGKTLPKQKIRRTAEDRIMNGFLQQDNKYKMGE
mgnify:CR=1 FL=1